MKLHGLLYNQLQAVDWMYQQSGGEGFTVYEYAPSVHDFHYQYLIPCYGAKKYGYVPCEYSAFLGLGPASYVLHSSEYQSPQKTCDGVRFLIIEKAVYEPFRETWYQEMVEGTTLLQQHKIGEIDLEKRKL